MGLNNEGVNNVTGDCIRKYERRKKQKSSSSKGSFFEDCRNSTDTTTTTNKNSKQPPDVCLPSSPRINSFNSGDDSIHFSVKDRRKNFLEQLYQSLDEAEGGLQDNIQDALLSHSKSSLTTTMKESVHYGEVMNGALSASEYHVDVVSNGSRNKSSLSTNTAMCKHALLNVLKSAKFTELCDLLLENFQGLDLSSVLDINTILSKVKKGAYESSPMLFNRDIQQVWSKLQTVGNEMVALANSLSEKSRASCSDKIFLQESSGHVNVKQMEAYCQLRASTCRQCKEKVAGQNCLVCDYCEDCYHVLCIKPAIQDIPSEKWYCTNCVAKGIGPPHENCLLCEKLNEPRSLSFGMMTPLRDEEEVKLEKCAEDCKEDRMENGEGSLHNCKICGNNVQNEKYKVCGHSFCIYKYYHERCLTVEQLKSPSSCWHCPSCLCRNCLIDRDDDKLVICDGCDEAFHIYCMQPPSDSIPSGRWFCTKCDGHPG